MFVTRWRWALGVALAQPRFRGGRKVPPQLARMGAEDLIAALFPDQGIDLNSMQTGRERQRGFAIDGEKKDKKEFTPVAPGSYTSAAIIMLTDGQRPTGVDPLDAAKMAADRGVRVYTVGIGTVDGETIGFEGWSMRVRLDEDTLKTIADRLDLVG